MERNINDIVDNIDALIGDTPVSQQLSIALNHMSMKEHAHQEYVTCEEFNTLKKVVEQLMDLVGDTSVAEQINSAIIRIK